MGDVMGDNSFKFDDQSTSDVIIRLRNKKGRPELFCLHSFILKSQSKYFADQLSKPSSQSCVEIQCTDFNYDQHVELLKRLYLPAHSLLDSWVSVRCCLGILQVAVALDCRLIVQSCITYLEAVPWQDNEEDEILGVVSKLGPIAMPILARIQPVDLSSTKRVFISALRFAIAECDPYPLSRDELRSSAQEQVDYMLGNDEGTVLVTADDEVKLEAINGLSKIFSSFERELSSLLDPDVALDIAENRIMQNLDDLGWMCAILLKMDLMRDFVDKWIEMSKSIIGIFEEKKLESVIWGLKVKVIEVTEKVLDAVSSGHVIVPAPGRVLLIKSWLSYIRKLKPTVDAMSENDIEFPYKMDIDLCRSIEEAMVSSILTLPVDDQADILADWMHSGQLQYPDLSEAFEVWCYRTKSAKRKLVTSLEKVDSATISL